MRSARTLAVMHRRSCSSSSDALRPVCARIPRVEELIRQIRLAAAAGLDYLALFGTLVIPDILGAAGSENGKATGPKYKDWLKDHCPEQAGDAELIYGRAKEAGSIGKKEVEQPYDAKTGRFLADRFIRGTCPNCKMKPWKLKQRVHKAYQILLDKLRFDCPCGEVIAYKEIERHAFWMHLHHNGRSEGKRRDKPR